MLKDVIEPFGVDLLLEVIGWQNVLNLGGSYQLGVIQEFLKYCSIICEDHPNIRIVLASHSKLITPVTLAHLL
ncbi:hypothetical protein PJP07_30600, partial [Mycobacterium kansasii]